MDGHGKNGFEIILSILCFNKMQTLFNLLDYSHKGAYFGVDQKFSHGEQILSKNADVIQLKCSVGILSKLLMELINPLWCLPACRAGAAGSWQAARGLGGSEGCATPGLLLPALPGCGAAHPPSGWGE